MYRVAELLSLLQQLFFIFNLHKNPINNGTAKSPIKLLYIYVGIFIFVYSRQKSRVVLRICHGVHPSHVVVAF